MHEVIRCMKERWGRFLKPYMYCVIQLSIKANQMEESFLNLIVNYQHIIAVFVSYV